MNKTVKQNGVIRLEADKCQQAAKDALSFSNSDMEQVKHPIKENEIGQILERILIRLEALERI